MCKTKILHLKVKMYSIIFKSACQSEVLIKHKLLIVLLQFMYPLMAYILIKSTKQQVLFNLKKFFTHFIILNICTKLYLS